MKTDSELQKDVMEELKWEPSVTHEHIGVSVSNGIVTLSGTVPSYVEKWKAEKCAQKVQGAKAIVEKLSVKLPGSSERTDEDIAQAVLNNLKWDIYVPHDKVKVKVENGWVQLSGELDWQFQKAAAENCVKNMTGVIGVANNITLKTRPVDARQIKRRIESAIHREAQHEANQIGVELEGDKVILTGKVHSIAEMTHIKEAAWAAPGVRSVENHLRVSI